MEISRILYRIYWRIQRFIAPGLRSSQDLYANILKLYVKPDVKWLDLGCGHQILRSWLSEEEEQLIRNCKTVVGMDYDLHSLKDHRSISLRLVGDISRLPFRSNSFDLVTANMVVEHLDNPLIQFQEVYRILKPGGIFVFHTPNALGYIAIMGRLVPEILKAKLIYLFQGRKEEDVFKTYYRVNTRRKINSLVNAVGFEIMEIKMVLTSATFVYIPPIVVLELIWIRILMTKLFKPFRADIIAILRKP